MITLNNRNINAAGKAETISTSRRINEAIAALRERRHEARRRILATEAHLKSYSNMNVSYVNLNGVTMRMPNL